MIRPTVQTAMHSLVGALARAKHFVIEKEKRRASSAAFYSAWLNYRTEIDEGTEICNENHRELPTSQRPTATDPEATE